MATKGQLKNATKFVTTIQKDKSIHKFDLMDKLSMSIAMYNQLKPYVEYRFGHLVEYHKQSKTWRAKKVEGISEGDKDRMEMTNAQS